MEASKRRIAILISGTGSNMEAIVRAAQGGVLREHCDVALVVSNRAQAPGLERARSLGVPALCVESKGRGREDFERELLAALEPHALDYLVLAGFMRVLGPSVVRRWQGRILNIHPADTARHRGLGGYRWAFDNRLERTAVTVHLVDEGLDTGPVLAQREVDLSGAATLEEVERRGHAVEHLLYPEVLRTVLSTRGGEGPVRPAPTADASER